MPVQPQLGMRPHRLDMVNHFRLHDLPLGEMSGTERVFSEEALAQPLPARVIAAPPCAASPLVQYLLSLFLADARVRMVNRGSRGHINITACHRAWRGAAASRGLAVPTEDSMHSPAAGGHPQCDSALLRLRLPRCLQLCFLLRYPCLDRLSAPRATAVRELDFHWRSKSKKARRRVASGFISRT